MRQGYGQRVKPDPLIVPWQGRQVRVRHDDPRVGPHTPRGAAIRSAIELATGVDGPRLVLRATLGDRYRVRVFPACSPPWCNRSHGTGTNRSDSVKWTSHACEHAMAEW